MEAKDKRDRLSRFVSKYMHWKCCYPGHILFFKQKKFFFTLFDDAFFMRAHFKIPVRMMDDIPVAVIPKNEFETCVRKIGKIKRTVRISGKSSHLNLVVDNSKGDG